jgi:hypothetical protein
MNQPEAGTETVVAQPAEPALASSGNKENNEELFTGETRFFPVSEGKLMTLYIMSFGLYGVFWFYKNWKLQQKLMDKKIHPVWRAIFSIFYTHSLFKRIDQQAAHLEPRHKFNASALATFFVFAIIVSNVLDRIAMNTAMLDDMANNFIVIASLVLFLLSTYPLLKVQATVNRINHDMLGYLNYKYSLANYVLMAIGAVLWLLIALGLLLETAGFAETM